VKDIFRTPSRSRVSGTRVAVARRDTAGDQEHVRPRGPRLQPPAPSPLPRRRGRSPASPTRPPPSFAHRLQHSTRFELRIWAGPGPSGRARTNSSTGRGLSGPGAEATTVTSARPNRRGSTPSMAAFQAFAPPDGPLPPARISRPRSRPISCPGTNLRGRRLGDVVATPRGQFRSSPRHRRRGGGGPPVHDRRTPRMARGERLGRPPPP